MIPPPSRSRLLRAWLMLAILTLAGLAAGGGQTASLGFTGAAAVVAIAGFKAWYVLMDYLNLRRAGGAWRTLLTLYLALIGGAVLAAYAAA